MKVKICGIRTTEDAQFTEASGADFLGLVFAPSKRRVTVPQAVKITGSLNETAKTVGVFVNESVETMIHIAQTVQLDYIQLHGNESAEIAKALPLPVIKAFSIDKDNLETIKDFPCDYLLIDSPGTTHAGGSGNVFDWNKVSDLNLDKSKLILAGGLHANNVSTAIHSTNPIGVDVSSGVETAGTKDKKKIKQFIQHAKANRKVENNDNIHHAR